MQERREALSGQTKADAVSRLRNVLEEVRQVREEVQHTAMGKTVENLRTVEAALADAITSFD